MRNKIWSSPNERKKMCARNWFGGMPPPSYSSSVKGERRGQTPSLPPPELLRLSKWWVADSENLMWVSIHGTYLNICFGSCAKLRWEDIGGGKHTFFKKERQSKTLNYRDEKFEGKKTRSPPIYKSHHGVQICAKRKNQQEGEGCTKTGLRETLPSSWVFSVYVSNVSWRVLSFLPAIESVGAEKPSLALCGKASGLWVENPQHIMKL